MKKSARQMRQPMAWPHERPSGSTGTADKWQARAVADAAVALPATLGGTQKSGLVDAEGKALDSAVHCCDVAAFLRGQACLGPQGFIGYATCAHLVQDGLMRLGVETLADEMVRCWGRVAGASEEDGEKLEDAMQRLRVRRVMADAAADAGYFGVGYVFIDTGERSPEELMAPLFADPAKMHGGITRLARLDPVLMSPGEYNAMDPLSRWYFRPRWWFVQGRRIHSSRIIRVVQNEPPFLLRPAYNFGGIPAVQMALDYLVHFTGTRESAARLLNKFSLTVMKSNLQGLMYQSEGAESDLVRRLKYFAANRDNDGVMLVDKEEEDVIQLNTPLSGVTEIVRLGLEMLAAIWHQPVTKYLGISPGGMNATGESDMRNWYDYAASQQETMLGPGMCTLLELLQASELGRVDNAVCWQWEPMWTPTKREQAETGKLAVDSAVQLVGAGIISQEEARIALSDDEEGAWRKLETAEEEPPMLELPDVAADSDEGTFARLWRRMTRRA